METIAASRGPIQSPRAPVRRTPTDPTAPGGVSGVSSEMEVAGRMTRDGPVGGAGI